MPIALFYFLILSIFGCSMFILCVVVYYWDRGVGVGLGEESDFPMLTVFVVY